MKISKATKIALDGARSEIIAGGVLIPKSSEDKTWNAANLRAAKIIDSYLKGEGLFQMKTKGKGVNENEQ